MSGETYLISHPRVVFFLIPSLKSMRMRSGNKEGKIFSLAKAAAWKSKIQPRLTSEAEKTGVRCLSKKTADDSVTTNSLSIQNLKPRCCQGDTED